MADTTGLSEGDVPSTSLTSADDPITNEELPSSSSCNEDVTSPNDEKPTSESDPAHRTVIFRHGEPVYILGEPVTRDINGLISLNMSKVVYTDGVRTDVNVHSNLPYVPPFPWKSVTMPSSGERWVVWNPAYVAGRDKTLADSCWAPKNRKD